MGRKMWKWSRQMDKLSCDGLSTEIHQCNGELRSWGALSEIAELEL